MTLITPDAILRETLRNVKSRETFTARFEEGLESRMFLWDFEFLKRLLKMKNCLYRMLN